MVALFSHTTPSCARWSFFANEKPPECLESAFLQIKFHYVALFEISLQLSLLFTCSLRACSYISSPSPCRVLKPKAVFLSFSSVSQSRIQLIAFVVCAVCSTHGACLYKGQNDDRCLSPGCCPCSLWLMILFVGRGVVWGSICWAGRTFPI